MTPPLAPAFRIAQPPKRPVLIYDGNCALCTAWVGRWKSATHGQVDFEPSTEESPRFPEIPGEALRRAVHLVEPDGSVTKGARAIFRARRIGGAGAELDRAYERAPVFARIAEAVYGIVARNRGVASKLSGLLWGNHTEHPSFATASWVFLRLLGAVYAFAFLSFWMQLSGLIGPDGILPAREFLENVSKNSGVERFWFLPTLAWIFGTGWFLHFLCFVGLGAGVAVAAGRFQRPALVVAWVSYLSLVSVGQIFMRYQWDILLLETGFAALFLVGSSRNVGWNVHAPSRLGMFLCKWILFRLTFLSGVVKLSSGDPTWRGLDALKVHFATQPLPTWIGWMAHQLPDFALTLACAIMFVIELFLPFLIWAPRRVRHFACYGMLLLQALILLTGNYTFFNWLTIALCLLLLSDDAWPRWIRTRVYHLPAGPKSRNAWIRAAVPIAASVTIFCGVAQMPYSIFRNWSSSAPVAYVMRTFAPLGIANNYGLFAVMTVERPEIIVQGSNDGRIWENYEFSWKPGDVSRRPRFVAPHQPRLDWQMWFAALGNLSQNQWFLRFTHKILQGEESVQGLLGHDPFDGKPPRYVRAIAYEYTFTTPGQLWDKGNWWKQGMAEIYMPPVSLTDFERN